MRIAITGAPRTGKSTLAKSLFVAEHEQEHPWDPAPERSIRHPLLLLMCTDPIHLVKDVEPGVTYVPRDVYHLAKAAGQSGDDPGPDKPWSSSSWYVAEHFLTRPGSWILEGVGVPRALRKWRSKQNDGWRADQGRPGVPLVEPCPIDKLIVLRVPRAPQLPGQVSQGKGCLTVLRELLPWLGTRVEWR